MSRYRRIAVAIVPAFIAASPPADLAAQRVPVPRPISPSPTSTPPRTSTGPALARVIGTVWDSIAMRPLGVGTILDARTIRDRSTVFVTDALRGMAGVTIAKAAGNGQEILMRRVGGTDGSYCPANIVLDGVRMPPSSSASATLDDYVNLSDVAAVEVYPQPNLVPAEFFTQDNACGVVVVWTRRGTGGVMPQKAKPPATP